MEEPIYTFRPGDELTGVDAARTGGDEPTGNDEGRTSVDEPIGADEPIGIEPPHVPSDRAARSAFGPHGNERPTHRPSAALLGTLAGLTAAGLGIGVTVGYAAFSGGGHATAGTSATTASTVDTVDAGLVDVNTVLGYQTARAAGTGMVLSPTGIILTNNHVVEGATSIRVTDVGNGHTYAATVLGYDATADVAVLQLTGASGLSTVPLGSSSNVAVGQPVVALGNAGGAGGTPKLARGTVTALDQSITAADQGSSQSEHLRGLIETDAGIQPGDSGGPLVDAAGRVIGMDTAASTAPGLASRGLVPAGTSATGSAEQAYAIPIDTALAIAHQITNGNASSTVHIGATAFLGVEVATTPTGTGAGVVGVTYGSPAASAGLGAGDVITSVGGNAVTSVGGLSSALATQHPGNTVRVGWTTVTGQSATASVQLGNGPVG